MENTSQISLVLGAISILVLVFAIARLYIMKACIGICCSQEYHEHMVCGFTCLLSVALTVLGLALM